MKTATRRLVIHSMRSTLTPAGRPGICGSFSTSIGVRCGGSCGRRPSEMPLRDDSCEDRPPGRLGCACVAGTSVTASVAGSTAAAIRVAVVRFTRMSLLPRLATGVTRITSKSLSFT